MEPLLLKLQCRSFRQRMRTAAFLCRNGIQTCVLFRKEENFLCLRLPVRRRLTSKPWRRTACRTAGVGRRREHRARHRHSGHSAQDEIDKESTGTSRRMRSNSRVPRRECMKATANVVIGPGHVCQERRSADGPEARRAILRSCSRSFADGVLMLNVPEAQYLANMEIHTPGRERRARCKNAQLVKGEKTFLAPWMCCSMVRPAIISRSSRSTCTLRMARAARCPPPSRPTSHSAKACPRGCLVKGNLYRCNSVTRPVAGCGPLSVPVNLGANSK